jgi:hypothetical protein
MLGTGGDDDFDLKLTYWKRRLLRATDQLAIDAAEFGMNDLNALLVTLGNDLRISIIHDENEIIKKNMLLDVRSETDLVPTKREV